MTLYLIDLENFCYYIPQKNNNKLLISIKKKIFFYYDNRTTKISFVYTFNCFITLSHNISSWPNLTQNILLPTFRDTTSQQKLPSYPFPRRLHVLFCGI